MNMDSGKNNILSVLTLKNDRTGEYYDILRKKTHLVARSGFKGDLEISGDTSVSRCHAEIYLVKEVICDKANLHLKLVDKNSMFGTFINDGINLNEKVTPNCPIILKLGDRIRFGVYVSTWTVIKYPVVACPSTLKMVDKDILRKSLKEIGGQVSRDWSDDCTHLCMNSITVTEKVLLCLASAKSIVIPKYFIDLSKALSSNSFEKLPLCIDYKPALTEKLLNPNIVSMDVNNDRKKLFSGKTFICSSTEQLNRISKIVQTAGGELKYFMNSIMCDDKYMFEMLHSNEYIIMQQCQGNTQNNEKYKPILDKLKKINKRPIPENEIGLSIIYANTTKHCNPSYDFTLVNIQSQTNISNLQSPAILEPETAEILTVDDSKLFSVDVVPDSLTQGCTKRSLDVVMDSEEIVMLKKRAIMTNDKGENDSLRAKENSESLKNVIKSTPSSSKVLSYEGKQNLEILTSVIPTSICNNVLSCNDINYESKSTNVSKSPNIDSCLTTVQNSQEISNKKDTFSQVQFLQSITADKNVNNIVQCSMTKRKLQSFCSMSNNEDDPFDYMDIDETEEHTKKKPKREKTESIFLPLLSSTSNIREKSKSIEPNQNISTAPNTNIAVDPNFIMNLLASAKGTGQFIDTSKNFYKLSVSVNEDSKHNDLVNSVITETVSMVVSRPTIQDQNVIQGVSHLSNFKKFRRKGPIIRIPNIVPLELGQDY